MSDAKKSATAVAEEKVLALWQKEKTFQRSVKQRQGSKHFAFNDGPPFANGLPHFGHSLVTAIKDSMLRYKTMRGAYVPRRNGWDCHGLPVEYDIEKEFKVSGKKQILELGLEKFNEASRASIFRYKSQWEEFLSRFGRWSDYQNYYATVDTGYTESIWWVLSEINKKGLLYRGLKSTPYCPRCETPLSNFELNEGYRDNVPDPSVYALFRLTPESTEKVMQEIHGLDAAQGSGEEQSEVYKRVQRTSTAAADAAMRQEGGRAAGLAGRQAHPPVFFLAWTTTPWTLPANAALAVEPRADYAYVKLSGSDSRLILAKSRLAILDLRKTDYSVSKTVKGKELVGLRYEPLYPLPEGKFTDEQAKNAHQVFADASVDLGDGSGILHVAPRYGETDLELGLKENLPLIESVNASGQLIYGPKEALGLFFKEADRHIIADLTRHSKIFAAETAEHTYPFCWRCDTPLMYFATSTWFVAVSQIRDELIKAAEDINWVPGHIKTGRFGKWLEGARDWAISRNRYWGAPLPIWQNVDDESDYIVIGSLAELEELAGKDGLRNHLPDKGERNSPDLHRPYVDAISFIKDGKTYKRVEEVLDCWFESGSMPVAQWHYPFENQKQFEEHMTADFVTEAIDQTRLWFYVQHVISTILFNKPAFKNVIVTGFILAADGQKLSKRLRNYPPVEEVFADEGADALRLYLLSSTQATETADYVRFDRQGVRDIKRNVLDTLANSLRFFKTYAEVDGWKPKSLEPPFREQFSEKYNVLDQWILARLNETVRAATKSADAYKIAHAILPIFELIDDTSNWYIRRSRRRFWKSDNDADKNAAYETLWFVLTRTSKLLAPWAPFVSEELWQQLTAGFAVAPKSVHLADWPSVKKPDDTSTKVLEDMKLVRGYIAEGLAQRAAAGIKVRQPLSTVSIPDVEPAYHDIIKEELNVKHITQSKGKLVDLDSKITDELRLEGIMRELVRSVQNARKKAGLKVEDRIHLHLESRSAEVIEAATKFKETIFAETLATAALTGKGSYSETVEMEGQPVTISLQRADSKH